MLKKTIAAGAVAAALLPGTALAQAPAPQAPASPHTLTGNVGLFSQYIFRGLSQTNREPAVQGGFDYGHASGFYAGTWASNISWLRDGLTPAYAPNPAYSSGGSMEWDFYGGIKGSIGSSDFTYDVGLLYYWYPGNVAPGFVRADTFELYGALGWKWLSAKLSYSLDNKTFGVPDSRGTWYLDFSADVPIGTSGFSLLAHYGIQRYDGHTFGLAFDNDTLYSYEDWKIGVKYALPKDFVIGAYYTDTSGTNRLAYGKVSQGGVFPRNIAAGTATVFLQKTF